MRSGAINAALAVAVALAGAGCNVKNIRATDNISETPAIPGAASYVEASRALAGGDVPAAERGLRQAVAANPALVMARIKLAAIYRDRAAFADAIPVYEALARLDPYTAENKYYLGLCLQLVKRLEESAAAYESALALEPDDFKSNMNLGLVYYALGRGDQAVAKLEAATRAAPGEAKGWSNLAVVLDARGDRAAAEVAHRRALELDGGENPVTLLNLLANLLAQAKARDAVAVAQRLVVVAPDAPLHWKRLGDAAAAAEQWGTADDAFDAALARDARFALAHVGKGDATRLRYERGMELDDTLRVQAVGHYERALALDPSLAAARAQRDRLGSGKVLR